MEQPKQDRLLYTVVSILIIIYLITGTTWLLYVALALHFIELLFGSLARHLNYGLSVLLYYIGRFNATLLLSIVYYLILTPIAAVARLLGKVGYNQTPADNNSQFKVRKHTFRPEDLKETW